MFKYILLGLGCFVGCIAYKIRKKSVEEFYKQRKDSKNKYN